jgi:hypothetical protein
VWITQTLAQQAPFSAAADKILLCKFADDGAAMIPAATMAWFQPSGSSWEDTFMIHKYRWWSFNTPGQGGATLVSMDTKWEAVVQFQ